MAIQAKQDGILDSKKTADLSMKVDEVIVPEVTVINEPPKIHPPFTKGPVAVDDHVLVKPGVKYKFSFADLFGADGTGRANDYDLDSKAFASITITQAPKDGILHLSYRTAPLKAGDIVSIADIQAGKLELISAAGFKADTFKYTVSDGANSSNIATVHIGTGIAPPVNHAPVAVDDKLHVWENAPRTIKSADLFGQDMQGKENDSDVDGNKFTSITITELPAHGKLMFVSGEDRAHDTVTGQDVIKPLMDVVKVGQVINVTDLALGKLVFQPQGKGEETFKYTVSDGKASSNVATVHLDVSGTVVQPPPVITNRAPVAIDDKLVIEGQTKTITAADLFGKDMQGKDNDYDVDGNKFTSITITEVPAHGKLMFSTTPPDNRIYLHGQADQPIMKPTLVEVKAGQVISMADLTAGKLIFKADGGDGHETFKYTVSDGKASSNVATVHLDVSGTVVPPLPVNKAPVAADDKLHVWENAPRAIKAADLFGQDMQGKDNDFDANGDKFTSITITALPAHGKLMFQSGMAHAYDQATGREIVKPLMDVVKVGQVINVADLAAGKLLFQPQGKGHESFKYTVSDGKASSNVATVHLDVSGTVVPPLPVNKAPVAADDKLHVWENAPRAIKAADLFGQDMQGKDNDFDANGDKFTSITITSLPAHGKLVLMPVEPNLPPGVDALLAIANVKVGQQISVADLNANRLVFEPHGKGHASFQYTVSDGKASSNVATVHLDVSGTIAPPHPTNAAPVAADDKLHVWENAPRAIKAADLFGQDMQGKDNDFDANGDKFTSITITALPAHGKLMFQSGMAHAYDQATGREIVKPLMDVVKVGQVINVADLAAGKLLFQPQGKGHESFKYTVSDGKASSNVATVHLDVSGTVVPPLPVNKAPVAVDDKLSVDGKTGKTITAADLFGKDMQGKDNDFDANGDKFTSITIKELPAHGKLLMVQSDVIHMNGEARLMPLEVKAGQVISVADLNAGRLIFEPDGKAGHETFKYTVSDGKASSNVATVHLDISGGMVPPPPPIINHAPVAVDDHIHVKGTNSVINLADLVGTDGSGRLNDYDADGDKFSSITITALPDHAKLVLTYTQKEPVITDEHGNKDSLGDITLMIEVKVGETIPMSTLANGSLSVQPEAGFSGNTTFKYTVSDGKTSSNEAKVMLHVDANNQAPVAVDDNIHVWTNAPCIIGTGNLFGTDMQGKINDFDPNGDKFTSITISSLPQQGKLMFIVGEMRTAEVIEGKEHLTKPVLSEVNVGQVIGVNDLALGKLIFQPNGEGHASFQYTVSDGKLSSKPATVHLDISGEIVQPPIIREYNEKGYDAQGYDREGYNEKGYDRDGFDRDGYGIKGYDRDGFDRDGYNPTGYDRAGYDRDGLDKNGLPPKLNVAPIAVDDHIHAKEDTVFTIKPEVLFGKDGTGKTNDADVDSNAFTNIIITSLPANGKLMLAPHDVNGMAKPIEVKIGQSVSVKDLAGGALQFVPKANFAGDVSFKYLVSDGKANSNVAKVTIHVDAVNDTPVANYDNVFLHSADHKVISGKDILSNDHDVDGKLTSITVTSLPEHGKLTIGDLTVQPGMKIAVTDLDAGKLVFHSDGKVSYTDNSFRYTVSDGQANSKEAVVHLVENTPYSHGSQIHDASAKADVLAGGAGADTFVWHLADVPTGMHVDKVADLASGETLNLTDLVSHGASLVIDNSSHTIKASFSDSSGAAHTQLIEVNFDANIAGSHDLKDLGGGVIKIG